MLKRLFVTILLLGLLSSPAYANLPPRAEPTPGTIPTAPGTLPGPIPTAPAAAQLTYLPLVAQNGTP